MRVLAVYNIKGGVGKTAAAVNLAYLAARSGLRTLVWDLDPQGAASFYFRIKPRVRGARKLMRGKRDPLEAIKGTDFECLDLLPADFSYRHMDLQLDKAKRPTAQLQRLLRPLQAEYDLLVLDCPPSISLVSENIFQAADTLLVPMIPTTLSVRTLRQLTGFLDKQGCRTRLQLFFSMVDRRKRMHREVMASLAEPGVERLSASIPYLSEVERMGEERAPLCDFAPGGTGGKAFAALWDEVSATLLS